MQSFFIIILIRTTYGESGIKYLSLKYKNKIIYVFLTTK